MTPTQTHGLLAMGLAAVVWGAGLWACWLLVRLSGEERDERETPAETESLD